MVFEEGESVEVFWDEEEGWFKGTIDKIRKDKGLHVLYEDGNEEWISWAELDQEGRGPRPRGRLGRRTRTMPG